MQLPLSGIRVMVTRMPEQSLDFIRLLEQRGAQVDVVPLIRLGPPPQERALHDAINRAEEFAWLIFTSAVGAESFARRRQRELPPALRIAAIGSASAEAVAEQLGRGVDVLPEQFAAEALANAITRRAQAGDRMLIVAAQDARPVLADRLRAAGFRVESVAAYTTVEAPPTDLETHIFHNDAIALASPSAVRSLVRGLGEGSAAAMLRGKLLACIGPVTRFEARNFGLHVEIMPDAATFPALVDALCSYYATPRP